LLAELREIGRRHGRSAAQVALAWVLHHRGVAGAIVGVRRPAEAEQLAGVTGIPPEELEPLAP
jgi:aryl-alcohol dehydrogenase-like predicted oxidoreductase